jgi:hypothetical protein
MGNASEKGRANAPLGGSVGWWDNSPHGTSQSCGQLKQGVSPPDATSLTD